MKYQDNLKTILTIPALTIIMYAFRSKILVRIREFIAAIKNGWLLKFIVIYFLSLSSTSNILHAQALSQEFSFTIKKGNDNIGKLKSAQLVNGNKITRTLSSEYNVSFLFDFRLTDFTSEVFVNNKLFTSLVKRDINGNEKVHNTARWTGTGYELQKKGEEVTSIKGAFTHTVTSLYFDEPDNYNTVFSSFFHKILTVKKVDAHKYALELPDGNKAYYSYNNGLLVNIEADIGWTNLTFILDNQLTSK